MADGDVMLDDDGNVILDADGDVQLSDGIGDDCCCNPIIPTTLPQLLYCDSGSASGLGLRPIDTPTGAVGGSVIEYHGICYTIGGDAADLVPTDAAATLRTSCATYPCVTCGACDQDSTPAHVSVTLSGVDICGGCRWCNPANHSFVITGSVDGTYDLPFVSQGGGACVWQLDTTGPNVREYFADQCDDRNGHSDDNSMTLQLSRSGLGSPSPTEVLLTVFGGGLAQGYFQNNPAVTTDSNCLIWPTLSNHHTADCVDCNETSGNGSATAAPSA